MTLVDTRMSYFEAFLNAAREIAITTHGYYATPPWATRALLDRERFDGSILEPCSGGGAMSRVLEEAGHDIRSSDIRDDVHGEGGVDVFSIAGRVDNAITNPPGRQAVAIAEHLVGIADSKVAILMKLDLYVPLIRKPFFQERPPMRIHVFTERIAFWVGGDPDRVLCGDRDWAWFVWEAGFGGKTEIDRITTRSN